MRSIDADYLLNVILVHNFHGNNKDYVPYSDRRGYRQRDREVREAIINAPTVEREKGEWIDVDGLWFRCSRCDAHRKMLMLGGLKENYCPNCGADMRGENE